MESKTCNICLDDFIVKKLPEYCESCNVFICNNCLCSWFEDNTCCPICKKDYETIDLEGNLQELERLREELRDLEGVQDELRGEINNINITHNNNMNNEIKELLLKPLKFICIILLYGFISVNIIIFLENYSIKDVSKIYSDYRIIISILSLGLIIHLIIECIKIKCCCNQE